MQSGWSPVPPPRSGLPTGQGLLGQQQGPPICPAAPAGTQAVPAGLCTSNRLLSRASFSELQHTTYLRPGTQRPGPQRIRRTRQGQVPPYLPSWVQCVRGWSPGLPWANPPPRGPGRAQGLTAGVQPPPTGPGSRRAAASCTARPALSWPEPPFPLPAPALRLPRVSCRPAPAEC